MGPKTRCDADDNRAAPGSENAHVIGVPRGAEERPTIEWCCNR